MSQAIADRLRELVEQGSAQLSQMPLIRVRSKPAPDKWSPIEIIGHLIDSAANNHQRFVRAQQQDNLVFPSYAQDEWVRIQAYQEADWRQVLGLWEAYNWQLARIIERTPSHISEQVRLSIELSPTPNQSVPQGVKTTLADFMADYVEHLVHHLKQLLPDSFE